MELLPKRPDQSGVAVFNIIFVLFPAPMEFEEVTINAPPVDVTAITSEVFQFIILTFFQFLKLVVMLMINLSFTDNLVISFINLFIFALIYSSLLSLFYSFVLFHSHAVFRRFIHSIIHYFKNAHL